MRRGAVTRAIRPEVYLSALQGYPRTQMLVVRTAGEPTAILPAIRREVKDLHPQLPLFATGTLDAQVSDTLSQPRFRAVLLAGFAAIAMLLASIGIYGVTAHAVSQRTQEVGLRMALGAQRSDVLTLILRQHLRPALIGVALGLAGSPRPRALPAKHGVRRRRHRSADADRDGPDAADRGGSRLPASRRGARPDVDALVALRNQ